jgi:hypothetical protein
VEREAPARRRHDDERLAQCDARQPHGGSAHHFGSDGLRVDDHECADPHTVRFEPFVGIGPHRYVDLFSMSSRAGVTRDRKVKSSGERIRFDPRTAIPKVEMLPMSYLDLEAKALYQLKKFLSAEVVRR